MELTKYNLQEATFSVAPAIERWAVFFLFADRFEPLQELLGDESSSAASLRERTIGELSTMLADLQQRLRSRES